MTLLDHLARLEALCASATPGPWRESPSGGFVLRGTEVVCSLVNCDGPVSANRRYFAALDPDTVRGLVAAARAAAVWQQARNGLRGPTVSAAGDTLEIALEKLGETGEGP